MTDHNLYAKNGPPLVSRGMGEGRRGGGREHGQCSDYGFGLQTNTKMSEYTLFLAKKSCAGKPSKYQSLNKISLGKQYKFCTEPS